MNRETPKGKGRTIDFEDFNDQDDDDSFQHADERQSIWSIIWSWFMFFGRDLMFIIFFGLQELNDTSYLHSLNMKSKFTPSSIALGSFVAHFISNAIAVGFFWTFASLLDKKAVKLLGCTIIYFIVSYETMFNLLKSFANLMELRQ